jgi:uncharacterized protein YdhG (YjbR/CyaY superfamily)
METPLSTPQQYLETLPADRREVVEKLLTIFRNNLPPGFQEEISYGMIGFVVPHSYYPAGYHCDPTLSLPFIQVASQKNHVAVYHMGLAADNELLSWFLSSYPRYSIGKPDVGKSCIRFRNLDTIPYPLIEELATKMTPDDWIRIYEKVLKK